MKSSPIILITASTEQRGVEFRDVSLSLSLRYSQAIQAAGGLPCVLPGRLSGEAIHECVQACDGVMLTGGDDVQPELYRTTLPPQLKRALGPVDRPRDLDEILVIEATLQQRKPLLAICRGQQILNVALGGTLLVDISSQKPQARNHCCTRRKDKLVHDVILTPDSLLSRITPDNRLKVNSSHHQAVDRVASLLKPTAVCTDGIIEGLELAPAAAGIVPYLLAVQFHPERLFERHPEFLLLFKNFVQACKKIRK